MSLEDYAQYILTCFACSETQEFFSLRELSRSSWVEHDGNVFCCTDCAYDGCECEECNRCGECDCSPCECNDDDNVRYPECDCPACRNGWRNECAMNEKTEV